MKYNKLPSKYVLSIFVLMFYLSLVGIVFSQNTKNVFVDVFLKKDILYPGDTTEGNIVFTNNDTTSVKGYIEIYAIGREGWFSIKEKNLEIPPKSTKKINMMLSIPAIAKGGRYYYYVYLKDISTSETIASIKKSFYVLNKPLLEINWAKVEHPKIKTNTTQHLYVYIKNIGELDAKNHFLTVSIPKLGFYKKYENISIKAGKTKILYIEIPIKIQTPPGKYEVLISLYDDRGKTVQNKKITFMIEETPIIKDHITTQENLFLKTIHVKASNEGNAKGNYTYIINAHGFLWIYSFENKKPTKKDGEYVISCNLPVKESCEFTIKINYWILYVVLIAIITLLVLLFISFTSPKVVKEYYIKGHKYYIRLRISNHKLKELHNVVLKDYINGIFKIDEESIIPKPSKIYTLKDKHVIEWKLGNLKPGETRMFKYEIIPKISVIEDLKLENAVLEGIDKRGKKHTESS